MVTVGHQDGASELVQERAVRFGVSDIDWNTREVHLERIFSIYSIFSLVFWHHIRGLAKDCSF